MSKILQLREVLFLLAAFAGTIPAFAGMTSPLRKRGLLAHFIQTGENLLEWVFDHLTQRRRNFQF